jgi:pimeloyl-ACP methyl ester carboxylesterase
VVHPDVRYARSGGLFIAYQVFGQGPLDLVVAPGYMSNVEQNWEWPGYARFLERLSSFSRVILLDRRGTGLSDQASELLTFDDLMDDIRAVMDDAGSEQAAVLGGAEGGPMCILFAATFPERTSALILVTSYARRLWAADYPAGIKPEVDALVMQAYEHRWGREPMGIHSLAPGLADDPAFRHWYVRAERFGGVPGRPWPGTGSQPTSTCGTSFPPYECPPSFCTEPATESSLLSRAETWRAGSPVPDTTSYPGTTTSGSREMPTRSSGRSRSS